MCVFKVFYINEIFLRHFCYCFLMKLHFSHITVWNWLIFIESHSLAQCLSVFISKYCTCVEKNVYLRSDWSWGLYFFTSSGLVVFYSIIHILTNFQSASSFKYCKRSVQFSHHSGRLDFSDWVYAHFPTDFVLEQF